MARKVYIESLGCPKNLVDSERRLGFLEDESDFHQVAIPDDADLILVNTCGFIDAAKEESIDRILYLASFKSDRADRKLAVTGCLVNRYSLELKSSIPEIDYIFDTDKIDPDFLIYLGKDSGYLYDPDSSYRKMLAKSHYSYLKIAEGCSNNCSFCVIPKIRGAYRSRSLKSILSEGKKLVSEGVKELVLVAQDSTLYGHDLKLRRGLADIVESLEKLEDLVWIRILYLYPPLVDSDFLSIFKNSDKLVPYFDIPFQHGSDDILKLMNRPETNKKIREKVDLIRSKIDNPSIRSSFITGFPSEKKKDFDQLLKLVEDIRFDHLGVFNYSDELDAASYKIAKKVSLKTALKRKNELLLLQRSISSDLLKGKIGNIEDLMIDKFEPDEFLLTGRLKGQAPLIDGEVILDQVEGLAGDLVKVKIVRSTDYDLIAKGLD